MAKEPARLANADYPLFRPGFGTPPPFLAGRETEKKKIARQLAAIASGYPTGTQIGLVGPRGNGKTALLHWAQETTQKGGAHSGVGCVRLTGNDFDSHERLVFALAGTQNSQWLQSVGGGLLRSAAGIASELFAGFSIPAGGKSTPQKLLGPVLELRSEKGLLVLVDEAHIMSLYPETASDFLNSMQIVAARKPLLLMLAGTPDLPSRLNSVQATFWSRIQTIGISLLASEAAKDAIRRPLDRAGYGIREAALDRAAKEAQRYPYFLQLVGNTMHIAAIEEPDRLESGRAIGDALLESALSELRTARDSYYANRYRELSARRLVPAAEAVARLFASRPAVPVHAFEAAVAGAIDPTLASKAENEGADDAALWAEEELRNVGFVWSQVGGERMCEPGIPSLMNYVVNAAEQRLQESEPGSAQRSSEK